MAAAKIATLAIRTLAKPIAAQIKQQAQHHERFRGICISLAQFMHRTEMIMRTNLLRPPTKSSSSSSSSHKDKDKDGKESSKDGKHEDESAHHKPRIRPLNEAKAVANGANALAEGFLFALAVLLIVGESYRGSRSRAKQRDRTEQGLEELRLITRSLAERIGADWHEIEQQAREAEDAISEEAEKEGKADEQQVGQRGEEGNTNSEMTSDDKETRQRDSPILSKAEQLRREREALARDRDRLQAAVDVLLRMSIKSGWIQGDEALRLHDILDGKDGGDKKDAGTDKDVRTATSQTSSQDQSAAETSQSPDPSTSAPIASQLLDQMSRNRAAK